MTEEYKEVSESSPEEKEGDKKSLSDKVADKVMENLTKDKKGKKREKKKLKPRKAKLSKGKRKKGYVVVCKIHENHHVNFEKVPVEESAYKLREDTFHALQEGNYFFYNGKYPMVFQPTTKKNPYNPLEGENETKGQKHIMNLMSKHAIEKGKKKAGSIILWIVLGVGGIILVQQLLG